MPTKPRCRTCLMPALMRLCLLICVSGCAATPGPPVMVPILPPMPAELHARLLPACDATDYRAALACAFMWRNAWREAEADKAAARELWQAPETPAP